MGKPSMCAVCRQRQLTSVPPFESTSHHNYCPQCAADAARASVQALVYYGKLDPDCPECLNHELKEGPYSRRLRRLQKVVYPKQQIPGLLVAISRQYARDAVAQHQEVLRREGRVVFGKFCYRRQGVGDTPESLENYRERYDGPSLDLVKTRVQECLETRGHMAFFVLDPDPPSALWHGRMLGLEVNRTGTGQPDFQPPVFSESVRHLIPDYYWLDPHERSNLRYHCNFWMLIDSLEAVDPRAVCDMEDLETGRLLTLATSQLYPAEIALPADSIQPLAEPSGEAGAGPSLRGVRVELEALLRGLPGVRLCSQAAHELAKSPPSMANRLVRLLLAMDRYGDDLASFGIDTCPVASCRDLHEFRLTELSRVAAGRLRGVWHIVGLDPRHPGPDFWREMRRRWEHLRNRL